MRKIIIILVALSGMGLQAQMNLDSLWQVWHDEAQPDSLRLDAMRYITWDGYMFSQPDSAYYFASLRYDLAKEKGLKYHMAGALNTQGASFHLLGNYNRALDHYQRSVKLLEEIGDKNGTANILNNIGLIYSTQKNNLKALDYFERALKVMEELKNKTGIANANHNIGLIYFTQKDNLKALDYYKRALQDFEEVGNKIGAGNALSSIGAVYINQEDYISALIYLNKALKVHKEIKNTSGVARDHLGIGSTYFKQGKHLKAISECQKAQNLAKEIGAISIQKGACECLYDVFKATGNGTQALAYHEQMMVLSDSLEAEETAKKLEQMEFQKRMLADSLKQEEEKRNMEMAHLEEVRKKNITRNILLGSGLLALLLAGGLWSRLQYVRKSKAVIKQEKDRSENLLLNILPAEIAEELKEKGKAEARDYERVSILFTDFKEFTQASEKMSATELVSEINHCFKAFDDICERYKIEKIKTIGDAYMAAGGLPIPSDDSVKQTVLAALDMQAYIRKRKAERDAAGKPAFEMRVGIHTGPVVAGIVGVKKFQYDVWGDTVNTASRMESAGEVGKVNISQNTYDLVKEDPLFSFESRGKIAAKGKGEVNMWFVSNI